MRKLKLSVKILLAISFIVLTVILFKVHFLSDLLIGVFFGLGLLLVALSLWSKRTWIQVILIIVLALQSFGINYVQNTLDNIIIYEPNETRVILFVVLENGSISSLSQLTDPKIGISVGFDQETTDTLKSEFEEKVSHVEWISTASNEETYDALKAGEIDVMVIDSAMIDFILEKVPDFEDQTKEIWAIEKSYIKEIIVKNADVLNESFAILISGIDTGGAVSRRSRSDVNIVMVVNPRKSTILLVTVARDTYVNLGCQTGAYDKLTHAGLYGVSCSVKTIENLLDIDINYYVKLNFSSFIKIVDVLGGIEVYSDRTFDTTYFGPKRPSLHFEEGMNSMDSREALIFSRERLALELGDVDRGKHQMEVVKGIINKITSFTSLTRIESIIAAIRTSIDTNFPEKDLSKMVKYQITWNPKWIFTNKVLVYKEDYLPTYSYGTTPLFVVHPSAQSLKEAHDMIIAALDK